MRISKYMTDCVSMFREALEKATIGMCLTDKDTFLKMNYILRGYGQHICYRTYQRYKAAAMAFGELAVEEQELFDPAYRQLYDTFLYAQLEQKENLFRAMMEAEGNNWIKYRWLLERKFPEYNLRTVTERYKTEMDLEKRLFESDLAQMGLPTLQQVEHDMMEIAEEQKAEEKKQQQELQRHERELERQRQEEERRQQEVQRQPQEQQNPEDMNEAELAQVLAKAERCLVDWEKYDTPITVRINWLKRRLPHDLALMMMMKGGFGNPSQ